MSYSVEPIEVEGGWWNVRVNGTVLHEYGRPNRLRRFKTSIKAAVAGAKYVDAFLRPASSPSAGGDSDG